jgi:DNA polymerase III epsilon subunit-like protein
MQSEETTMTTESIHPADELGNIRLQIAALRMKERRLSETLVTDRELRVGQEWHAIVRERQANGGIVTEVETQVLPDLRDLLALLRGPLLAVDVETTGLCPARDDRVLALGTLGVRFGWTTSFGFLYGTIKHEERLSTWGDYLEHFNPEGRVSSPEAARVHGLSDEYLARKMPFDEHRHDIAEMFTPEDEEPPVLIGHNIPFDLDFLNAEFDRHGWQPLTNRYVDTRLISKLLWPGEPGSLDALCIRLGVDRGDRDKCHDALDDCHLVARCIPGLIKEIEARLA